MEPEDTTPSVGAKRLRSTATQRADHLSAWERSGLSATAYAQAHGLRAGNLYAWRRKCAGTASPPSSFIPVRIGKSACAPAGGLRVTLKASGLECVIEGAGEHEAFAVLAAALRREVFDV